MRAAAPPCGIQSPTGLLARMQSCSARTSTVRALQDPNAGYAALPRASACTSAVVSALALAEASQRDGIMLAPGAVFRPHLERSPWMGFNVTACEDTRVQQWLQHHSAGKTA
jgi:hypothetical protein